MQTLSECLWSYSITTYAAVATTTLLARWHSSRWVRKQLALLINDRHFGVRACPQLNPRPRPVHFTSPQQRAPGRASAMATGAESRGLYTSASGYPLTPRWRRPWDRWSFGSRVRAARLCGRGGSCLPSFPFLSFPPWAKALLAPVVAGNRTGCAAGGALCPSAGGGAGGEAFVTAARCRGHSAASGHRVPL